MTINQINAPFVPSNPQQQQRADFNTADSSIAFHTVIEIGGTGEAVSSENPLPISGSFSIGGPLTVVAEGSNGTDYSANAAAIPIGGYVLLATVPALSSRNAVEIQNQSNLQIQLVLDDGSGGNTGSILLAGGSAADTQGGAWSSEYHKGRVRIYGSSSSQQVFARAY